MYIGNHSCIYLREKKESGYNVVFVSIILVNRLWQSDAAKSLGDANALHPIRQSNGYKDMYAYTSTSLGGKLEEGEDETRESR